MSKLDKKHNQIVGEDGELLEADTRVDLQAYADYAAGIYPEPTRWERIQQFMSGKTLFWLVIIGLLIAFTNFLFLPSKSNSTTSSQSDDLPLGKVLVPTLESIPDVATDTPSIDPIVEPYLPTAETSKIMFRLPDVSRIRWSPDGNFLASQSDTTGISVWDVSKNSFFISGLSSYSGFDWSADGHFLYVNRYQHNDPRQRSTLTALQVTTPFLLYTPVLRQPQLLSEGPPKLLMTAADNKIALLSGDGLLVDFVDPGAIDWKASRRLDSPAHDIDWEPNGTLSAVTETAIWQFLPHSDYVHLIIEGQYQQVSWSPTTPDFAVTQDVIKDSLHHPSITVINPYQLNERWSKQLVQSTLSIKSSTDFNVQVAWSPDGERIATFVQNDSTIDLWDAKTGTQQTRFYSKDAITCIDWSPNGQFLAIGSSSGVSIWSPA